MHSNLGKDEIIVSISLFIFALVYRISKDYQENLISSDFALFVLIISVAYLLFNRSIKLIVNRNKNNFYCTSASIRTTKYVPAGKGSYLCYVIEYEDKNSNTHVKELHSVFSIKTLKVGDKIKINVDHNDPDNIIVAFSDLVIAIITCIIGIIFESVLIAVYVIAH